MEVVGNIAAGDCTLFQGGFFFPLTYCPSLFKKLRSTCDPEIQRLSLSLILAWNKMKELVLLIQPVQNNCNSSLLLFLESESKSQLLKTCIA